MLNAVIIDDEETAIYVLADLLNNFSSLDIKIAGTAFNMEDGIEIIKRIRPDIIFLDNNMIKKNKFEIHDEIKSPHFKIIFCTAYQQYADDVFRMSASAYLLKPIELFELHKILQKVYHELMLVQNTFQFEDKINILGTPEIVGENIILNVENGFIIGNTRDIEYCYGKNSFSVIMTNTQKGFLVNKSLNELQEILPQNHFNRIHQSYLVNINYNQKIVHANEKYVIMKSGIVIPVAVRTASVNPKQN